MKDKDIVIDPHGRRPGLRRLTWKRQPLTWGETKDQLRRLVASAPEVVIVVEGGGSSAQNVRKYMTYISRNGKLPANDDKGEPVQGLDGVNSLHESWDLDMSRGQGRLHMSFNVILSMPKATDPASLFRAAELFAREQLGTHEYMLVLHTRETDPRQPAPEHPHVHLTIKAEDREGQRLYIRKATLRAWRESFAAQLRAQGIEANATPRSTRGVSFKGKKRIEYQIIKRGAESTALAKRFAEASHELQQGDIAPKPWELAMAARRRDVERELSANAARLRQEGDRDLAASVERFARELPPLTTERNEMQRAIVEQVTERLHTEKPAQDTDKSL